MRIRSGATSRSDCGAWSSFPSRTAVHHLFSLQSDFCLYRILTIAPRDSCPFVHAESELPPFYSTRGERAIQLSRRMSSARSKAACWCRIYSTSQSDCCAKRNDPRPSTRRSEVFENALSRSMAIAECAEFVADERFRHVDVYRHPAGTAWQRLLISGWVAARLPTESGGQPPA
jgi:hypothetical protein